ncbi:MAG: aminoacyl-tRNA hydrolase [Candidatus Moranbacteria bacterium]|nr:aminoacyl-tRNA hydrolase [Candidatus Moranbacteria bacterium]
MNHFLIAGLGNPGIKYQNTRHNAGFLALDYLAENFFAAESFSKSAQLESFLCHAKKDGRNAILVKPQTYMNNSGRAIAKTMNYFDIKLENLLVIHDDVDLELGKYKISEHSGSAGHKGVASIINYLDSKNFRRIRAGVDAEERKMPTEKFVLQKLSKEELRQLMEVFQDFPGIVENMMDTKTKKA